MMKKLYNCPDLAVDLMEDDVVLASVGGSAVDSDEFDNPTQGGFDL